MRTQTAARKLAKKGRHGDKYLLHISHDELMRLASTGRVTRNPETGLPEAWGFSSLSDAVSDFSDSISNAVGDIGDWASQLTGNPLGIPGFDLNMITDPSNVRGYSPVTKAAAIAGAGELAFGPVTTGGSAAATEAGTAAESGTVNYLTGEGVNTGMGATTGYSSVPGAMPSYGGAEMIPASAMSTVPGSYAPAGAVNPVADTVGAFDLGGGLGVDELGNVSGGLFEGGPGTVGSEAFASSGGGFGDFIWNSMKKNPFGWAQLGMGGLGLYNANQLSKAMNANARASDPFASQRAMYQGKLSELMDNPSSIEKIPGWKAGMDAVNRKMASQGYIGSGNMMVALQNYGGQFFNDYADRLAKLAGATYNGDAGRNLMTGNRDILSLYGNSLNNMLYGSRDIYNG